MEAFRLDDAPMLEARRSRAAALAGSEDAEGLAERAAAGERLTDEELAALLLSPRISTEALLAIARGRHRAGAPGRARARLRPRARQHRRPRVRRVRPAARRRVAAAGRRRRSPADDVHVPGDVQPPAVRALHGDGAGQSAERLRAPALEL